MAPMTVMIRMMLAIDDGDVVVAVVVDGGGDDDKREEEEEEDGSFDYRSKMKFNQRSTNAWRRSFIRLSSSTRPSIGSLFLIHFFV